MSQADTDWKSSHLPNAVKHFKYEQRGKRRFHQKPTGEVSVCLTGELELVGSRLVVTLGLRRC